MNYEGNGCKVWRGYNDLIGLYGLGLIMIQVRFVNIRESGFRTPGRGPGSLCLRDPDFQLWKPKSKFHWQRIRNPAPGIWNPCRGIPNPRLPYLGLVRCYSRDNFAVADPGGAPPLILDQTEARKAEKKNFCVTGPPPSGWVPAPPPHPLILRSESATALPTETIPKSFPPKTSHGTKKTTNHNGNWTISTDIDNVWKEITQIHAALHSGSLETISIVSWSWQQRS